MAPLIVFPFLTPCSAFYLFTGKYSQIKRASVRSHQPAHRHLEGVAEESDDAVSMCSHHSVKSAPAWERGRGRGVLARDHAQPRWVFMSVKLFINWWLQHIHLFLAVHGQFIIFLCLCQIGSIGDHHRGGRRYRPSS